MNSAVHQLYFATVVAVMYNQQKKFLSLLSPYFRQLSVLLGAHFYSGQYQSSKLWEASLVCQFHFLFYLISFASHVEIANKQTALITLGIDLRIIIS